MITMMVVLLNDDSNGAVMISISIEAGDHTRLGVDSIKVSAKSLMMMVLVLFVDTYMSTYKYKRHHLYPPSMRG